MFFFFFCAVCHEEGRHTAAKNVFARSYCHFCYYTPRCSRFFFFNNFVREDIRALKIYTIYIIIVVARIKCRFRKSYSATARGVRNSESGEICENHIIILRGFYYFSLYFVRRRLLKYCIIFRDLFLLFIFSLSFTVSVLQ